jgi:hypothetical protein
MVILLQAWIKQSGGGNWISCNRLDQQLMLKNIWNSLELVIVCHHVVTRYVVFMQIWYVLSPPSWICIHDEMQLMCNLVCFVFVAMYILLVDELFSWLYMYMLRNEEISHCSFKWYYGVVICHCVDLNAWRLSMYLKILFKVWLLTCDPMVGC